MIYYFGHTVIIQHMIITLNTINKINIIRSNYDWLSIIKVKDTHIDREDRYSEHAAVIAGSVRLYSRGEGWTA